jgi:hypothetical protein
VLLRAVCTGNPWAPDTGYSDSSPDGGAHTDMGSIGLPATGQIFHIAAVWSGYILLITIVANKPCPYVNRSLAGIQKDFPVVSDGILEGVLRQTDLLTALSRKDAQATEASILRKDASTVLSTDMLDTVITTLSECRCDLLPVTREGKLVGVVTTENLGAFMRLREASVN